MATLTELLGRIWMDGYHQEEKYEEIEERLEHLESDNTSAKEKHDNICKIDHAVDKGYNSLFYATLFLSNKDPEESWLGRIIRIAESIETDPDLMRSLFTDKDHEDKTILVLLIETERDNSEADPDDPETTRQPMRRNYIQFLCQKYRALGLTTQITEAQQFCNSEGIDLTLNTMGGFRKRRKSKRKKSKSRKSRKS